MAANRQSITFTKLQLAFLQTEANRLGVSVSELVRRIIDQFRESQKPETINEGD